YVLRRFCDGMGLWSRADREYLSRLFSEGRRLDRAAFYADPYLAAVKAPEARIGRFLLTQVSYDRGEIFQYDMPDVDREIVVPKLGFFDEKVLFPAVYEGEVPWVSVCPSEIRSMGRDLAGARGRCLVLGLGLGYYPFRAAEKDEVRSVTVVERSGEIIDLFEAHILPAFPRREKIRVVQANAFDFLAKTKAGEYDFCYADIWEGAEDGAACYKRIKPEEKRLSGTLFSYWIEKEIRWFLEKGGK
ncbi:MAG: hypothetical protein II776_03270, partial [Clostridia bacterium]|nr:hypothetical protein [Clostridia bacterium]